jgi:hypothetical protein
MVSPVLRDPRRSTPTSTYRGQMIVGNEPVTLALRTSVQRSVSLMNRSTLLFGTLVPAITRCAQVPVHRS